MNKKSRISYSDLYETLWPFNRTHKKGIVNPI